MYFYEGTYLVDSRDIDPDYHCRPSSVLGMLQEAATSAACALHVSRDEMLEKYNGFWMLARIWYRLTTPLLWGDAVTVRTYHRPVRGASIYRDFDITVNGRPVGEATSVWVVADAVSRKLIRAQLMEEFQDSYGDDLCKEILLPKLHLPGHMAPADTRTFYYSDTDVNQHVNNTRYADFICDAVHLEILKGSQFVSSLQVDFLAECLPGQTVVLHTAAEGGLWYVHGVDAAGKSHFDGSLGLSDAST